MLHTSTTRRRAPASAGVHRAPCLHRPARAGRVLALRPVAQAAARPAVSYGRVCWRLGASAAVTTLPSPVAAAELQAERQPSAPEHAAATEAGDSFPAQLTTKLSTAHTSACTAALVMQDEAGEQLVATASLDKSLACWRFSLPGGPGAEEEVEVSRLKVPGAPVFSLAKMPTLLPDGTVYKQRRTRPPGIFMGTHNKEVVTWMLGSNDVTDKVKLGNHTGWVRSLAITDKWLFTCGCNVLRIWDTTFPSPKEVQSVKLFTGDILAIAASKGRVFTAGADGSLRSWRISKQGMLEEGPKQDKAHDGRVASCVVHEEAVYTAGYDGSIKVWSADTLGLICEARHAHGGDKVHCLVVAANNVLYTGGDDKAVRAWSPQLVPLGASVSAHSASVRVLTAGKRGLLVSADADGDVCVWEVTPQALPSAHAPDANASPLASYDTVSAAAALELLAAQTEPAPEPAPEPCTCGDIAAHADAGAAGHDGLAGLQACTEEHHHPFQQQQQQQQVMDIELQTHAEQQQQQQPEHSHAAAEAHAPEAVDGSQAVFADAAASLVGAAMHPPAEHSMHVHVPSGSSSSSIGDHHHHANSNGAGHMHNGDGAGGSNGEPLAVAQSLQL